MPLQTRGQFYAPPLPVLFFAYSAQVSAAAAAEGVAEWARMKRA